MIPHSSQNARIRNVLVQQNWRFTQEAPNDLMDSDSEEGLSTSYMVGSHIPKQNKEADALLTRKQREEKNKHKYVPEHLQEVFLWCHCESISLCYFIFIGYLFYVALFDLFVYLVLLCWFSYVGSLVRHFLLTPGA
jgi:hypothetical protein